MTLRYSESMNIYVNTVEGPLWYSELRNIKQAFMIIQWNTVYDTLQYSEPNRPEQHL